jgi:hypothetical protein
MPQPPMTFKQRAALAAYTFALRLLLPAILLRYWLRGRKEPGYRVAMHERLGYGPAVEPGWSRRCASAVPTCGCCSRTAPPPAATPARR